jgi:hypothetical protein
MTGGEQCQARRDLERSGSTDDDEARIASFIHPFNEAADDRYQLIRVIVWWHVGADDRIGPGDYLCDAFDIAEVISDGFDAGGELVGIANDGGDVVATRLKFTENARAGIAGRAIEDNFHADAPVRYVFRSIR